MERVNTPFQLTPGAAPFSRALDPDPIQIIKLISKEVLITPLIENYAGGMKLIFTNIFLKDSC